MSRLALILLFCALALGPRELRAEAFSTLAGDLPMMAGLTEYPDHGLVFDTPAGRIVETYAGGELTAEAIQRFYRQTLSQLGWTTQGMAGMHFVREDEMLTIDFPINPASEASDTILVRFRISPRPQD